MAFTRDPFKGASGEEQWKRLRLISLHDRARRVRQLYTTVNRDPFGSPNAKKIHNTDNTKTPLGLATLRSPSCNG
eukprot:11205626-Lingulodinium_polyedra.AAC.1